MISLHTLLDNRDLSADELALAQQRIAEAQRVFDQSHAAIAPSGPQSVFAAANVWKGLALDRQTRFPTDAASINLLRMKAPFAGYHLSILDRVDGLRHFPPLDDEVPRHITATDNAREMWDRLCRAVDPAARLMPYVAAQHLTTFNLPSHLIVRTPGLFGEIGTLVDGVLCNADTILCQTRINALYAAGALERMAEIIAKRGTCRVLEIGPGYGALARTLMEIFPGQLEYILCDLPSGLFYSSVYVGHYHPEARMVSLDIPYAGPAPGCTLVPNHLVSSVVTADFPVDVAINTMSMPEMSVPQVDFYAGLIASNLSPSGFFYEANTVMLAEHVDCKAIFARIFPCRLTVTHGHIGLGGETHEIWSNQPFDASRPPETAPACGPLADMGAVLVFDALGRALQAHAGALDGNLRWSLMMEAGRWLLTAGLPSHVIAQLLSGLGMTPKGRS